jgi:hypothetical protein
VGVSSCDKRKLSGSSSQLRIWNQTSPFGVYHIVAFPAIVRDAIESFELVHREDAHNSIGQVPHLDSTQVLIDFYSSSNYLDILQVLVTLEGSDSGASVEVCPVVG